MSTVYSVKITQLVSKSTLTKHVYVSLAFYRMRGQTLVRCFDVTCNPSLPAWYVTLTIGVPIIAYDTLRTRDAPSWRCKMTESWHWKRKLWKCPDIEEKQTKVIQISMPTWILLKKHKMFIRPSDSWYPWPPTQAMCKATLAKKPASSRWWLWSTRLEPGRHWRHWLNSSQLSGPSLTLSPPKSGPKPKKKRFV